MLRSVWMPALALGVMLAANGAARAADNPAKSDFGATMTLAGTGTAAEAASADDTELAHYYRGYGGYRGGYYGGYRGGYYGGYRGYYGGFGYGGYGYRPYYAGFYRPYYRPYYSSYYYRPYYGGWGYSSYSYGYGYGGYGYGGYCGISASEADTSAPIMTLALKTMNNPIVPREPASTSGFGGGFRYDGGPANPVALPKWEPTPTTAAASDNLPVSLQKSKPTVNAFKAYGEK